MSGLPSPEPTPRRWNRVNWRERPRDQSEEVAPSSKPLERQPAQKAPRQRTKLPGYPGEHRSRDTVSTSQSSRPVTPRRDPSPGPPHHRIPPFDAPDPAAQNDPNTSFQRGPGSSMQSNCRLPARQEAPGIPVQNAPFSPAQRISSVSFLQSNPELSDVNLACPSIRQEAPGIPVQNSSTLPAQRMSSVSFLQSNPELSDVNLAYPPTRQAHQLRTRNATVVEPTYTYLPLPVHEAAAKDIAARAGLGAEEKHLWDIALERLDVRQLGLLLVAKLQDMEFKLRSLMERSPSENRWDEGLLEDELNYYIRNQRLIARELLDERLPYSLGEAVRRRTRAFTGQDP